MHSSSPYLETPPIPYCSVQAMQEAHAVERQPSSIEDFPWPISDPRGITQRTRPKVSEDDHLVDACLSEIRNSVPAILSEATKLHRSTSETIVHILGSRRFQMNPVTQVRSEREWIDRVEYCVEHGEPISIVYPLFCVIPCAPKRYETIGPTAGEDCTIRFFGLIDSVIKEVYAPGICICALADAKLFSDAFATPKADVDAYQEGLEKHIVNLGAQDYLKLYDYEDLLKSSCDEEYNSLLEEECYLARQGHFDDVLPGTNLDGLRKSVRASINTRSLPLSHYDHLALFGPKEYRDSSDPYYDLVEQLTDVALAKYVAIRASCDKVDIATRLWPHALRATCHKGTRNGRWPLGLRPYPEYFSSCKLLPYHGMPRIVSGKHGTKLEILPEVMLRGDESLIRVESEGQVYAYISTEIDE